MNSKVKEAAIYAAMRAQEECPVRDGASWAEAERIAMWAAIEAAVDVLMASGELMSEEYLNKITQLDGEAELSANLKRARTALEAAERVIEEVTLEAANVVVEEVAKAPEEGWGNPRPFQGRSKFHYFDTDGRSLCGKWGRFAGYPELEQGKDEHSDNCAECKRRKIKHTEGKTA